METIKESVLKYELQRELDRAKVLEKAGKIEKAGEHYLKAGIIYRRIASFSPLEKAQEMFDSATHYEKLAKAGQMQAGDKIVESFIVTQKTNVTWNEIGNLDQAKREIKESIILPFIQNKPEYVTSPRTILLYGPPGTGKTLLAKASSNNIGATFFEARLPSLLSKYFGESPKLISALFNRARKMQPSLIFIDELDAIAVSRDSDMDEASRRVLSQLLTEIEGFNTRKEDKILIMAATNKPWDLDDAIVSRFQRKIHIPLPDINARKRILNIHLKGTALKGITLDDIAKKTESFSGRDLAGLCQEAIMNMVREENPSIHDLSASEIAHYSLKSRPLTEKDFEEALQKTRPAMTDIRGYEKWRKNFGG